jgi:hypothetical protein
METTSENRWLTVVLVGQLIDGTGAEPRRNVGLIVEDGVITRIDDASWIPRGFPGLDLGTDTVLPGLIKKGLFYDAK